MCPIIEITDREWADEPSKASECVYDPQSCRRSRVTQKKSTEIPKARQDRHPAGHYDTDIRRPYAEEEES
jgi:hypothetical protein